MQREGDCLDDPRGPLQSHRILDFCLLSVDSPPAEAQVFRAGLPSWPGGTDASHPVLDRITSDRARLGQLRGRVVRFGISSCGQVSRMTTRRTGLTAAE